MPTAENISHGRSRRTRPATKRDLIALSGIRAVKATHSPDVAVHEARHAGGVLDGQDAHGLVRQLPKQTKPDPVEPEVA